MVLKGRIIGPIIFLVFTILIIQIAIERGELLDFSNGSLILFNFVCFLSIFLIVKLLFFFPRIVFFDTIESYKLQPLGNFPGYYLQLNFKSKKNKKKILVFNIKGRDLDNLDKLDKMLKSIMDQRPFMGIK